MKLNLKKLFLTSIGVIGLGAILTSCIDGEVISSNNGTDSLTFEKPSGYIGADSGTLGTSGITFVINGDNVTFTCPVDYPDIVDGVKSLASGKNVGIKTKDGDFIKYLSGYISSPSNLGGSPSLFASNYINPAFNNNDGTTKLACVKNKDNWEICGGDTGVNCTS